MSSTGGADPSLYLRTELLERVAHELRGPAGVTLGALDELEHMLGPQLVDQNRTLFAMARRGARRVLRTAERLSRTALLESGQPHVSVSASDLRAVLQQAIEDAELVEGRSSVRVAWTRPDQPCVCEFDQAWLLVALSELIAQAIRCARREVEVTVEAGAEFVTISVRDDRVAFAAAPAERFTQLDDRRDAALAWPIVSDIARAHRAELSSEPLRDPSGAVTGARSALKLRAA